MKIHAFRLLPGQDLVEELERFAAENSLGAGVLLSAVGSLSQAVLRDAGGETLHKLPGPWEIVSATGTLCTSGLHLHLSLADEQLALRGGHAKPGCLVLTTVEVVVGEIPEYRFERRMDPQTGYKELIIQP